MKRRKRRRRSYGWKPFLLLLLLIGACIYVRNSMEIAPSGHRRPALNGRRHGAGPFGLRPDRDRTDMGGEDMPSGPGPSAEDPEEPTPPEKEDRQPRRGRSEPSGPRVALVLDDCGYGDGRRLLDIEAPLTLAVLPGLPFSRQVARDAGRRGFDVLLHLPMEPEGSFVRLEENTILTSMRPSEMDAAVSRDLDSLPEAVGVNNHMGSKATADRRTMDRVMKVLAGRDLFFLDSLTTGKSVGREAATAAGVPFARRDVFLDGEPDEEYIRGQVQKLIDLALSRGQAIGIGHDRPHTVEVIEKSLPDFEAAGVDLVLLSDLL